MSRLLAEQILAAKDECTARHEKRNLEYVREFLHACSVKRRYNPGDPGRFCRRPEAAFKNAMAVVRRAYGSLTCGRLKKRNDFTFRELARACQVRLSEQHSDELRMLSMKFCKDLKSMEAGSELCKDLKSKEAGSEDEILFLIELASFPTMMEDHVTVDCQKASYNRRFGHGPTFPFICEKGSTNDGSKLRHCHFRTHFDWKGWKRQAVGEMGLKTAPWFEWLWRKRFRRDNVYTMQSWPRGHCIIIGNIAFEDAAEERECYIDLEQTRGLFLALHFDCVVAINLKAHEIKELIRWAAEPTQQDKVDCLVVVLMSHGVENHIFGTDGERVHLYEDVYEKFNNENCPQLQGKPKLFFVQACRGGKYNNGASVQPSNSDSCPVPPAERYDASPPSTRPERTSSWSDMYIVYATILGFVAYRNEETGSWLLSAMREVFLKHAHNKSLDWLMRKVSAAIRGRSSHDGSRQTVCIEQLGWTKKLYFNTGRMDDSLWKDVSSLYNLAYFIKHLP